MTTATGDLPDTLTYHDRRWFFMGLTEPAADGVLIVQQYRGSRAEVDRYRVEEQPAEIGVAGRVFLLAKQSGERADIYQTIVGPMNWCQCTAGRVRHVMECKHVTAVRVMIADGVL